MTDRQEIFELKSSHIELYKLLKLYALAGSGGEAKHLVDQGLIRVNDEIETRKRRKLVVDDVVIFDTTRITIVSSKQ